MIDKHVGIINYRCGNIQSILNTLNFLGVNTRLINSEIDFLHVSHVILPGVGSLKYCVDNLKASNLLDKLELNVINHQMPLLGICVGMQMMFSSSEEDGGANGLAWFEEKIEKLCTAEGLKVPHVGWNEVNFTNNSSYFTEVQPLDYYFDHSFALKTSQNIFAKSKHADEFISAVKRENILACQFHPEKSQANGIKFLKYFLEECS